MRKYPHYEVPNAHDFQSFVDQFDRSFGDAPAITTYNRRGEERTRSYQRLADDVRACAEAICRSGLRDAHLAVVGENSYEWIVAFLGIVVCGGVAVLIDTEQPEQTIRERIEGADCMGVFASPEWYGSVGMLGAARRLYIRLDPLPDEPDDDEPEKSTLAAFLAGGRGGTHFREKPPLPGDTAVIVYTSGTTSQSKPVMLGQDALIQNALDAVRLVRTEGRQFVQLPLHHTYGLSCSLISNLDRGIHLCVNGNMKTLMRDIELFRPTTLLTVPLLVEVLHKRLTAALEESKRAEDVRRLCHINRFLRRFGFSYRQNVLEDIRRRAFGELTLIVCGGAHLDADIQRELLDFGLLVLQGYGITECGPLISTNRNRDFDMTGVGRVVPHYELRVEDGELCVRGLSLMQGYYKNPALTAESIIDGWFHTGDMGYLDRRGHLHINGRRKNLIVFKNGQKICPEIIEQYVRRLPLVGECVAHAAATGASADDVKLAVSIYPDPERSAGMSQYQILESLQEGIDDINKTLPAYQQIQMINIRDTEFVKTASRKIRRGEERSAQNA